MKAKRLFIFAGTSALAVLLIGVASANFFGFELPKEILGNPNSNDQKVSGSMQDVSAGKVFEWLRNQGLNFVIDTTDIPSDRKVSVNFKSVDGRTAIESVAEALNLSWTKKGDVYVLKPGHMAFVAPFMGEKMTDEERAKLEKEMAELGKRFEGFKAFSMDGKEFDHEAFAKKMEEFGKRMGEKFEGKAFVFGPESMEKFEKELAEGLKGLEGLKDLDKMIMPKIRLHLDNLKKFFDSLTDEQKKLMERQGHLKPSDLTPAQREMLGGISADDKVNLWFNHDGKKVRIQQEGGRKPEGGAKAEATVTML